ncbi:MAG: hypothetical protein VX764_07470 [Planctomycetota bacterium]|nr:hypothetical protein [Planctomycetota bacterium]
MRPVLTASLVVMVLFSSLLQGPMTGGDEPSGLPAENSAELSTSHLQQLTTAFSELSLTVAEPLIGDRHPDLFGSNPIATVSLWQPPIRDSLIFETSRNLIRRQLQMDLDLGKRGYFKGVCWQQDDPHGGPNQPLLLPLPLGGFDLCLVDPLLDAPLLPPAPALSDRPLESIWRHNRFQTRHELIAWPDLNFGGPGGDSTEGGVRASLCWDAMLPRNHQYLSFQMTASLDATGESGCLLQICWQGIPRSP